MHRMVDEYVTKFYLPAINSFGKLTIENNKELKNIMVSRKKVLDYWNNIYIKDFFVRFPNQKTIISGEEISVEAYVYLADAPKDLFTVEIFYQYDDIDHFDTIPMYYAETYPDKVVKFERSFTIKSSGQQNINVRLKPSTADCNAKECHLIKWRMKS
jgi:starch phosphorylase